MEFQINHESLSNRSSDAEYFYTDHFLTSLLYDVGSIERAMKIRGIYDPRNYDSDGITDLMKVERGGEIITKTDGKWRKYNFISPINIGFARDGKLLPPNIPYRFKFIQFDKNLFSI